MPIQVNLNKKEIGKRIRILRGDMSQRKFCKLVNYHQSLLSHIEGGQRAPTLELLFSICNKCDTSMDYILRGK